MSTLFSEFVWMVAADLGLIAFVPPLLRLVFHEVV